MFVKKRLMTPGPTLAYEDVRLLLAASHPHHRSEAFMAIFDRALSGLRWLWETDDDVLFVTGSGTAGMEAALRSALLPSDRVVVGTGGKFAERWRDIVADIGCDPLVLAAEWGESLSVETFEALLASSDGPIDALVLVASETSTGALHPVVELAAMARAHSPDVLVVVDGITAVGCVDLSMRRHGIDVLVSGTQKAFGLPPGGAMVGMSERAWARVDRDRRRPRYLDLRAERKQTAKHQTAFTPSIPLIVGLELVMQQWQAVGRDALLSHAGALSQGCIAGVRAMGLRPFPKGAPSPALTTVETSHIDASRLVRTMRDRCGVTIAGGQDHLKGQTVRIGHIGAVDPFDIVTTLSAMELALREQGVPVEPGAGAGAALDAMSSALLQGAPVLKNP